MRIAHKRTAETRSILEARWALFFRELNLRWKYEPVKIRAEGSQYTPDFEVIGFGYVEIKPTLELFIKETAKRLAIAAMSNPETKFWVFCSSRVDISTVALYHRNAIFAPTLPQVYDLLSAARSGSDRFTKQAREADIKRAMVIANTRRFSEWRTSSEILLDVMNELERVCA